MEFGYHNVSFRNNEDKSKIESTVERAKFLEKNGFSWFSFMDHLWQEPYLGYRDEDFFDCYTMLPVIARETDSIDISSLVTCTHYRNPALLGRIITTLDHISNGRAILGIGAGWVEQEYEGYGYEFSDISTRISQMENAIELIKHMWNEPSPITYKGEYYSIKDVYLDPKPVQTPHPPVLIGGNGEKLTLRAVAKHADGWNALTLTPRELEEKLEVLKKRCNEVERNFDDIEVSILKNMFIRETNDRAKRIFEEKVSDTETGPFREDDYGLVGSPEYITTQLKEFQEIGADLIQFMVMHNDKETIEQFCNKVAPKFN